MNEFDLHTVMKNSLAGGVLLAALGLMAFGHAPEVHAAPAATKVEKPAIEHLVPGETLEITVKTVGYSCAAAKKAPCLPMPAMRSDMKSLIAAIPRGALK